MSLHEKAAELAKTMRCNCDLDNWEPEQSTGHNTAMPVCAYSSTILK